MKVIKTASGKKTIKMSKVEWQKIGKKAGWMKVATDQQQMQLFSQFVSKMLPTAINSTQELYNVIQSGADPVALAQASDAWVAAQQPFVSQEGGINTNSFKGVSPDYEFHIANSPYGIVSYAVTQYKANNDPSVFVKNAENILGYLRSLQNDLKLAQTALQNAQKFEQDKASGEEDQYTNMPDRAYDQ